MSKIFDGRYTARIEGDFVVFVIGMRINKLLAVNKWLPVTRAMPRMLRELFSKPELGLLHAEYFVTWRGVMTLQYWRSFDQLHAYAHAKDSEHLPAWAAFNRAVGNNGSVGVYHESYLVSQGRYESVYVNMPQFGLAGASEHIPAVGRMETARARLGQEDAPVK